MAFALDPVQAIMAQQLREFNTHVKKLKNLDDRIESFYENGEEPPERLSNQFEELKEEFMHFRKYFKAHDTDYYFQSEEWDVPKAVKRCIAESYGFDVANQLN